MQPSHLTRSPNLPCELLVKIVDQLDDESLIQCSMTCKELHSLALDTLFTRFEFPKDITSLYLRQPPAHLLRALRMALFVHRASSFVITPDPNVERLLPDVLSLNRLISRMSTMTLSTFNFPRSSLPLSNEDSPFDEERWTTEVIRLFDMVLDKSCAHLRVSGDMIPTHPTSTGAQRTNAPPTGTAHLRRLSCEKICHRLRTLSNTPKRTILSLIRHPGSRRHHRILRHFHALSPDLFQPQFLDWTTSTLTSSRTLTTVSFKTDRVPASTWHGLLPKLTLPSLVSFQVTCDRMVEQRTVDFNDVLNFLTRHPSIVDLDLYGLTAPTNNRLCNLLPALQRLTSYPALIIWLLDSAYPLRQLNIVSEVHRQPLGFDYNTFDHVLALLPGRAPLLTTLTLSFFSVDGVIEWLDNHLSRGPDGPLAVLERITSLEVVSPRSWEGVVTDRIPEFLAQFPGLEHFIYPAVPPHLDMETVKRTFLMEIALTCPEMRKVTIGQTKMVDLDSLRKV